MSGIDKDNNIGMGVSMMKNLLIRSLNFVVLSKFSGAIGMLTILEELMPLKLRRDHHWQWNTMTVQ